MKSSKRDTKIAILTLLIILYMIVAASCKAHGQDANWRQHQITQNDCTVYHDVTVRTAIANDVTVLFVLKAYGVRADVKTIFWCAEHAEPLRVRYWYDAIATDLTTVDQPLLMYIEVAAPEHR